MWSAIRKVLGALTDILTLGRAAGLWSKKPTVPTGPTFVVNAPKEKKVK